MKIFFILFSFALFATPQAAVKTANDTTNSKVEQKKKLTEVQKMEKLRLKLEKKNLLLVKKQIDAIRLRNQTNIARKAQDSDMLIN